MNARVLGFILEVVGFTLKINDDPEELERFVNYVEGYIKRYESEPKIKIKKVHL